MTFTNRMKPGEIRIQKADAIITGHSGMASQKMFTDLEQLREGDIFYLHVLDETLAYEPKLRAAASP